MADGSNMWLFLVFASLCAVCCWPPSLSDRVEGEWWRQRETSGRWPALRKPRIQGGAVSLCVLNYTFHKVEQTNQNKPIRTEIHLMQIMQRSSMFCGNIKSLLSCCIIM